MSSHRHYSCQSHCSLQGPTSHTDTCTRAHTHTLRRFHNPAFRAALQPAVLLPVVVADDRRLAGEAQHPAHHPAVVPGPALVTHLPPVALVLHLHSSLGHQALPLGTGKDGLEPHLLQPPALWDAWSPWAPGFLPPLSPLQVFTWESWGSEHLEITPPSALMGRARKQRPRGSVLGDDGEAFAESHTVSRRQKLGLFRVLSSTPGEPSRAMLSWGQDGSPWSLGGFHQAQGGLLHATLGRAEDGHRPAA